MNIGRRKSSTNKRAKVNGSGGRKKAKLSSSELEDDAEEEEVYTEGEVEVVYIEEEGEGVEELETQEEPKVCELLPFLNQLTFL